jgi:hypothetical protein
MKSLSDYEWYVIKPPLDHVIRLWYHPQIMISPLYHEDTYRLWSHYYIMKTPIDYDATIILWRHLSIMIPPLYYEDTYRLWSCLHNLIQVACDLHDIIISCKSHATKVSLTTIPEELGNIKKGKENQLEMENKKKE